jgi:hypothetical protein
MQILLFSNLSRNKINETASRLKYLRSLLWMIVVSKNHQKFGASI